MSEISSKRAKGGPLFKKKINPLHNVSNESTTVNHEEIK